ncbi:hypothetical protein C2E23DRAFT_280539 [Lenzites betulinus]|nr:hypothetical protein C2E23DRAFT_280539 [Lenzites betulinus]
MGSAIGSSSGSSTCIGGRCAHVRDPGPGYRHLRPLSRSAVDATAAELRAHEPLGCECVPLWPASRLAVSTYVCADEERRLPSSATMCNLCSASQLRMGHRRYAFNDPQARLWVVCCVCLPRSNQGPRFCHPDSCTVRYLFPERWLRDQRCTPSLRRPRIPTTTSRMRQIRTAHPALDVRIKMVAAHVEPAVQPEPSVNVTTKCTANPNHG